MQVSVETTTGLERKMTVKVPAEKLEQEIAKRLGSMTRTVKLDGFRPGKVPLKVVATRFGKQVRQEVVGEVTRTTLQQAIRQEELRLASMPRFESQQAEVGKDLEYTVIFEVMQKLALSPVDDIKIEKPVSEVSDSDIDTMIETLRKQRLKWSSVERTAKNDDQITIDFKGSIDGEFFQGGEGKQYALVLGSNSFIDGFEEQLLDQKAGDELAVSVTFPDTYHVAELAGKAAEFAVTVHDVAESQLPEVDEEFIKNFEIADGTIEGFRAELKNTMTTELAFVIKEAVKKQVMDALLAKHEIELPKSLVNEEIGALMQKTRSNLSAQGVQAENLDLDPSMFEEKAKERVTLTMVVNEIVRQNGLSADAAKVRAEIESQAASYDDPSQIINWYYSDPSRLSGIEAMVLENEVVDWVLTQAVVTDKQTAFSELMHGQQQG